MNLEEKECSLSIIENDLESIATDIDRRKAHEHMKHDHKKHEPLIMKPSVPRFIEDTCDERKLEIDSCWTHGYIIRIS